MKSKYNISIQEYLSLGYVFIVVLGIISDVIYYSFLGINIMSYTTILDILITPISIISMNIVLFLSFIGLLLFAYFYTVKFLPWFHFKYRHTKWYTRLSNVEKLDRTLDPEKRDFLYLTRVLSLMIISMYIGFGIGRGGKIKSRIDNNEIKVSHILTFEDQEQIPVGIVGQNTQYIFYVEEGKHEIMIAPIMENIKTIQKVEDTD